MTSITDPVYTTAEAAAMLGLTARTLQVWRHERVGPKYEKVSNRVFYRHSVLEAYRQSLEIDPPRKHKAGGGAA